MLKYILEKTLTQRGNPGGLSLDLGSFGVWGTGVLLDTLFHILNCLYQTQYRKKRKEKIKQNFIGNLSYANCYVLRNIES